LVDDGVVGLPARVIYNIDLASSLFIPTIPANFYTNDLISDQAIPYAALTAKNIAAGSSFVIDYT
jgi:hypothetical protein